MANKAAQNIVLLDFFLNLIQRDYGVGDGTALCRKIQERLNKLKVQVDDRGSVVVRRHIDQNILPVISCFQVLAESGMTEVEARAMAAGWMHEIAEQRAASFRKMTSLPFFYALFRLICPSHMKKNYPHAGWDMRFKRRDRQEMAFDCYRCIYLDVTRELGCPELCIAFCENDDITYGAMQPKIHFIRTKTLADGGDCCDFRLINGKYHQSCSTI